MHAKTVYSDENTLTNACSNECTPTNAHSDEYGLTNAYSKVETYERVLSMQFNLESVHACLHAKSACLTVHNKA